MADTLCDCSDEQALVIMRGVPASGQTTAAKKMMDASPITYKRVSKDDIRDMLDFGSYSTANEFVVRVVRDAVINQLLKDGWSVIIDDTNLNPEHIARLRELASDFTVQIVDLTDVPLSELINRDLERDDSVGEKVIRKMADKYLPEQTGEIDEQVD